MQTVTILRELWRLRLMVVLAGLVAIVVGVNVAYEVSPTKLESRKYSVGIASARILVDTPDSQVVEVAPEGSDSTGVRANLLANLMVEGEIKTVIAKRVGLRPDQLEGVSATTADPGAAAAPRDPRGYVLTTDVLSSQDGERLPIIEIEAQAPDAAKAAELAQAAIAGLGDHLDSKAALDQVPNADRLRLSGLGAPQARDVVRGPSPVMAIGAAIFIFLAGCTVVVVFFALVRAWRVAEHAPVHYDYDPAVFDDILGEGPEIERRTAHLDTAAAALADNGLWSGGLRPAPPPDDDEVGDEYSARTA